MEYQSLIKELKQQKSTNERYDYLKAIIKNDLEEQKAILENLEHIYELFPEIDVLVDLLFLLLLEENGKKTYDFISKNNNIKAPLYRKLYYSGLYKHRMSLAELIAFTGINNAEEKKYVKELLNDNIVVVARSATRCLNDFSFTCKEIAEVIDKFFYEPSHILQGCCPALLIYLKNIQVISKYVNIFIMSENFMVRYNLCVHLNELNCDDKTLMLLFDKLPYDEVEEINLLFLTKIKHFKNEKLKFATFRRIINHENEKVRMCLLNEISMFLQNQDMAYKIKFLFYCIKNMINDKNVEINIKTCEIFCENLHKIIVEDKREDNICKFLTNLIKEEENNICDNFSIHDLFNDFADFSFIITLFERFINNEKWRIREATMNLITKLSKTSLQYYDTYLKYYHMHLFSDKIEEIRSMAYKLTVNLYKNYGPEFLLLISDDLRRIAKNKKYSVKVNVIELIREFCNVNEEIFTKVIYEILLILSEEKQIEIRKNLSDALIKYEKNNYYENIVKPILIKIVNNEECINSITENNVESY